MPVGKMKNDITAAGLVLAYVPIKNIGISSFNSIEKVNLVHPIPTQSVRA
jgi:hypothetical protein